MQEKGDEKKIQILEEVVQNVCMVVDVVMKKAVMATVSGMGKIKKKQKKKETGDGEGLASKMELKETMNDTIEDLMRAWRLIEDAQLGCFTVWIFFLFMMIISTMFYRTVVTGYGRGCQNLNFYNSVDILSRNIMIDVYKYRRWIRKDADDAN